MLYIKRVACTHWATGKELQLAMRRSLNLARHYLPPEQTEQVLFPGWKEGRPILVVIAREVSHQ